MLSSRLLVVLEFLKLPIGYYNSKSHIILYIGYLWYRWITWFENIIVRRVNSKDFSLNHEQRKEKIIASLTTYPDRINTVFLTIKTLFLQTYKPDRIILWLAESQFPDKKLPNSLEDLVKYGLEIRFCDDYKSHKKYLCALQEQNEDEIIITFDDDIIYDLRTIAKVYKCHLLHPECIVVHMSRYVKVINGEIQSYKMWKPNIEKGRIPSFRNSPLTGSGCLYPYLRFNQALFDFDLIKQYALGTDDLWIYFLSVLSNIKIVSPHNQAKSFSLVSGSQITSLYELNGCAGGNDNSIKNLQDYFPQVVEKIIKNE